MLPAQNKGWLEKLAPMSARWGPQLAVLPVEQRRAQIGICLEWQT